MKKNSKHIATVISSVVLVGSFLLGSTAFAQNIGTATNANWRRGRPGEMMGADDVGQRQNRGVLGTVNAIMGTTVTVTSKGFGANPTQVTYTVDASNATVMKNGTVSSISGVLVGDTVFVQGNMSSTTITATMIRDGVMVPPGGMMDRDGGPRGFMRGSSTPPLAVQGNGQPVIGGRVTTVSSTTISITNKSNVSYTVDTSSAKIILGNMSSTLASVTIGDPVIVQGAVNGNSVVATMVVDQKGRVISQPQQSHGGAGPTIHKGVFDMISGFFGRLFGF